MTYTIRHCATPPQLAADWEDPVWQAAETLQVSHFLPQSSDHHPETFARLLYDDSGLHGIFCVRDRYVRCIRPNYFDQVWKDSCVEFFVRPKATGGYFNFEFNCGGAHLCCYITDSRIKDGWFAEAVKLPPTVGQKVKAKASLPRIIDPELTVPTNWTLQFFIPFSVLEEYAGPLGDICSQTWHGNFFKCAEDVSHPHWAAWAPVSEFNFHLPDCFGDISFEDSPR